MCYANRPHYILAPRLVNQRRRLSPPPNEQQRGRGRGGGRKFFVLWRLFSGA